jgi:hypothetical protein
VIRPYDLPDPGRPVTAGAGALVLRLHDGTLDRLGIVQQPGDGTIRRSLVAGDTLWTVSDAGVGAVSSRDLSAQAWVPFSS